MYLTYICDGGNEFYHTLHVYGYTRLWKKVNLPILQQHLFFMFYIAFLKWNIFYRIYLWPPSFIRNIATYAK